MVFLILLLIFAACGRENDDIGGSLPMVITDWTGNLGNDALLQYITEMPETYEVLAVIGDDQPIPRRVAAQMLDGILLPHSINPDDDEMLTLEQAQTLIQQLNPVGRQIQLTEDNEQNYISYALWVELFLEFPMQNLQKINIVPFAQQDGVLYTNLGEFGIKSINLGAFFDQEIHVLHKNREILAVIGITNFYPTLKNALITHADAFGITLFVGGTTRNYTFQDGVSLPGNTQIANIQIHGRKIIAITSAEAAIQGTIERVRHHQIELMEWGALPLCPNFAVYGLPTIQKSPHDLLVGENIADFFLINGRVGAAVITREITPTKIRVAINTTGFTSLVHESVTISSTGEFTVRGNERTEIFVPGAQFTVSSTENTDLWGNLRLYISPTDDHRLEIVGLGRNWPGGQSPSYRGTIEVSRYNGGGFIIVNELCIEEYLFAVIPSEMPTAHGLEAAKVQAITARSFAMFQFYQNAFMHVGAHVDDSVISQVHNNIPETEISIEAVNATRGQVLSVGGELVIANYFSTSGGTTANFGEVWARGSEFPTATPIHLRSMLQFDMNEHNPGDLSQEKYATQFFRDLSIPAFDRQFAWFRWHVQLTAAELTASINANLQVRQAANPAMVQVLDANGIPTNARITTIGRLIDMEVVSRGQGGNIMEMIFTGTEATVRVRTEFNIRTLLNPGSQYVQRHDGSRINNLTLLPSAFFAMQKETDTNGHLVAVSFFGGGNGHGVGKSQNGVRSLVELGLNYIDILRHYYPGAEVASLQQVLLPR